MGLQSVSMNGPKAPTTYYGYTEPDEPKENYQRIKKDEYVEGFYHGSWEREGQYGKQWNHTLVREDGTHHVIPGSKDVNRDFLENAKPGLFTRYTYLGKKSFDYTSTDKDGKEIKGTAKAIKGLIQQDPDRTCSFEGDRFSAVAVPGSPASLPKETAKAETNLTAEEVPF